MAKKRPEFHYDICVACGICVQNCPVSALSLKMTGIDPQGHVYPGLNGRTCIGCGICAKDCPMGAAAMKEGAGSETPAGESGEALS